MFKLRISILFILIGIMFYNLHAQESLEAQIQQMREEINSIKKDLADLRSIVNSRGSASQTAKSTPNKSEASICTACNGQGKIFVPCPYCYATGTVQTKCNFCFGKGKQGPNICNACKGKGTKDTPCSYCGGGSFKVNGKSGKYQPCNMCNGTGKR